MKVEFLKTPLWPELRTEAQPTNTLTAPKQELQPEICHAWNQPVKCQQAHSCRQANCSAPSALVKVEPKSDHGDHQPWSGMRSLLTPCLHGSQNLRQDPQSLAGKEEARTNKAPKQSLEPSPADDCTCSQAAKVEAP